MVANNMSKSKTLPKSENLIKTNNSNCIRGNKPPYKFIGIVNKVESLICKMNTEKFNSSNIPQPQKNAYKNCAYEHQSSKVHTHSTSLDSLNHLTDGDSFDEIIYTDSDDAEIAHITGTTAVQIHRRSDLDQLTDETIREFNEQCSSLSHDLDMDNTWSTEESDYKCCNWETQKWPQQQNTILSDDICVSTFLNQRDNNNNCKTAQINCCAQNDNIKKIDKTTNSFEQSSKNEDETNDLASSRYSKNTVNGNILLSNNGNGFLNTGKSRRPSIASSGSVSRMETILEEPVECKISVKEILARFETLNMTEAQSKASTISSGARAAAQTLNVPIERLESRQSNNRDPPTITNSQTKSIQNKSATSPANHDMNFDKSESEKNNVGDVIENYETHFNGIETEFINLSSQHIENHADNVDNQNFSMHTSYNHSPRNTSGSQQYHSDHHFLNAQHLDANYMLGEPSASTPPSVTKYSLLQFAMQHFRNDQLNEVRSTPLEGSDRSYADLVKWQGAPLRTPLLRLPNDLAPLALECFDCILRYCGDIALDHELTEVKCVYTVLMHCHKYLALRDEVYCQLMKQTTANRSPCPDSSQRAWRLLSILAAYFGCSDALRPYLMEHLTSAASDRRRSCHGTAAVCLTNLRKTARCGGRKNVPSVEEVTAVSAGRSARRQIYRLPGGAERVVNTRCSTVVADVIAELCSLLGISSEAEQQEFSLYCIVQGDAFTMPLAADEYILDVTTELLKSGQPFYLIFCRSVWHFSLKRDPAPTPLYVEVLFNQVAPDYLEGLLLELPSNGIPTTEVVRDMAHIAALLHRAADLSHIPAMKEIKFLLPKPALTIREIRPAQWVGLVQSAWPQIANLSAAQVKGQFLNVLATWPLFGSSFFAVKRIWAEDTANVDDHTPLWRDLILALNRRGVLFLDPNTHETLQHWPFMEVISTRKVRSEDGALYLDMKVGNLMQQRVIRVQTEQAHEISRLVRQYITMAQITQRDKREAN